MIDYCLVPLSDLLLKGFDENKIIEAFKKFSCQREVELEDFLLNKAIQYENAEIGKTFLFFDSEELKEDRLSIMAYYTLGHNALDISGLSQNGKRKLLGARPGRDNMTSVSTFLIGQLGRSDSYTSKDLSGETILSECYNSISIAAKVIGGNIVFLECREHMYASFYEKQGFKKLHQELNNKDLYELYKKVEFTDYWNKQNSI